MLDSKIYSKETSLNIAGTNEMNLKVFKDYFDCDITFNGEDILTSVISDDVKQKLERIFQALIKISDHNISLYERDIIYIINLEKENKLDMIEDIYLNRKPLINNQKGKLIYAKTINQKEYIRALDNYDLVFGIGPAGTGKTYIAVAHAVKMLKDGKIKKIILTRPAVEAGESLGFLPGDLKEKVDPYLRPLYDALYEFLGFETVEGLIEKNVIEIAPLAYMRGRTLENAYVILDEAQNTTAKQMKMFLTRLGFNSKMVVTGDISQIDLPKGIQSGLVDATRLLGGINEISIIEFEKVDVVRHPIVAKILERYEKAGL